jgi:BASS family bile acid:Na+ symporter
MGALVLGAAVLALVFPETLQQVPTKAINYMLGVVMFGMGLTLRLQDFKIVFSRPKDVVIGCLAQFTVILFHRPQLFAKNLLSNNLKISIL